MNLSVVLERTSLYISRLCFALLYFTDVALFKNLRQDLPSAKRLLLTSLQYSIALVCNLNPRYFRGMPICVFPPNPEFFIPWEENSLLQDLNLMEKIVLRRCSLKHRKALLAVSMHTAGVGGSRLIVVSPRNALLFIIVLFPHGQL